MCLTCGATLSQTEATSVRRSRNDDEQSARYDFRYGETDLLEGDLNRIGRNYLTGIFALLVLLMIGGLLLILAPSFLDNENNSHDDLNSPIEDEATPTPSQIRILPTITIGPPTDTPIPSDTPVPTPTLSPTPEPCIQIVQAGEGLYNVALRCGHRDLAIIDVIVELNGLASAESVQEGQEIIVPYPTPTFDPNAVPTETPIPEEGANNASDTSVVDVFDDEYDPLFVASPTLPPDITFHTVVGGETIIDIISNYNSSVEILSQINPEVQFSQCDFGLQFGGPRCIVFLLEGQNIRVPAPTQPPTLSPTPNGSETATPTPTPTFNAPSVVSPSDRFFFTASSLVTLRWIGSGALAEGQSYRLEVEDVTAGVVYIADTTDNSMILPADWQGTDGQRHEYIWIVSVIDNDNPDEPYFTTTPQTFFWQALEDEA